jgi:hypothetical protein
MAKGSGNGREAGPEGSRVRDAGADEPSGARRRRQAPAGTIARPSGKDGPQIVRSGGKSWTDAAEEIFLDRLAASNNATWAAEQTGFSRETVYKRARRDPGFAERMAAARSMGIGRVDELLLRRAEDFLSGRPFEGTVAGDCPPTPFPEMTVQDAIAIQKLNRPSQTGEGRRPAWPARPRTLDEVRDSILAKLSAIARKRGLI